MQTVKKLLKEFYIIKYIFSLMLILMFIAMAIKNYLPMLIKKIIDDFIMPLSQHKNVDFKVLLYLVLIYINVLIVNEVFSYFVSCKLRNLIHRITRNVRNRAFSIMLNMQTVFYDKNQSAKISTYIVNDLETLERSFYINLAQEMPLLLFQILIIYFIIFTFNIYFGFIMLLMIPVCLIGQKVFTKYLSPIMDQYFNLRSLVNIQLNDVAQNHSIVQIFQNKKSFQRKFEDTLAHRLEVERKEIKFYSIYAWSFVDFFRQLFIVFIISFAMYEYFQQDYSISLGTLFLMIYYANTLYMYIGNIIRISPEIPRALSTASRIYEFMAQKQEENTDHQLPDNIKANLEFKDISFAYSDDKYVLNNVSFALDEGKTLAIVGNTGSGKSSLINLLCRFYDPQVGKIKMGGLDISHYQRESMRKQISLITQDPYLFSGTVASNISMGQNVKDDEIITIFEKLGIKEILNKWDQGIHSVVKNKGENFSAGEKQLISFARALFKNPKILILDEATSNIDTQTESFIQIAMENLKKDRTTIIIAHRLSTIKQADKIIVLQSGEIKERGNHESLLKTDGIYASMYKTQQKI